MLQIYLIEYLAGNDLQRIKRDELIEHIVGFALYSSIIG